MNAAPKSAYFARNANATDWYQIGRRDYAAGVAVTDGPFAMAEPRRHWLRGWMDECGLALDAAGVPGAGVYQG